MFVDGFRRWSTITEPGPYLQRVVLNRCRDLLRRDSARRSGRWATSAYAAGSDAHVGRPIVVSAFVGSDRTRDGAPRQIVDGQPVDVIQVRGWRAVFSDADVFR
ncbi:MAG: hypothetical protein ACKV2O_16920 [Acidimicrobiales bacterium]